MEKDPVVIINEKLTQDEILAQLMEECAELIQAAAKMRRNLKPDNPTPISKEEALGMLAEETADVFGCLAVLGIFHDENNPKIVKNMTFKLNCWAQRLQELKP